MQHVTTQRQLRPSLRYPRAFHSDSGALALSGASPSTYIPLPNGTEQKAGLSAVSRREAADLLPGSYIFSSQQANTALSSQIVHDGTQDSSSRVTMPQSQLWVEPRHIGNLPKRIHHLTSLTDRVLTKRTQLQHEEETLDRCQTHLHDSTQLFMSTASSNLPHVSGAGTRKKRKKRKPRSQRSGEDDLAASINLTAAHDPPAEGFSGGPAPLDAEILNQPIVPLLTPGEALSESFKKYQTDYEALNLQKAKISLLRTELTRLEFRLRRKQESFEHALQALVSAVPELGFRLGMNESSSRSSSGKSSQDNKSDTPTILAEYFNRKGDIGVYRDRLMELDYNFQEGLIERELVTDRGDPLGIPDDLFLSDYETQRKAIAVELESAEQEAQDLAERCEAEGIDTTATRVPSSSNSSSSQPPPSVLPISRAVSHTGAFPPAGPQPRDAEMPRRTRRSSDRVEGWLHNIPPEFEPFESESDQQSEPVDGGAPQKDRSRLSIYIEPIDLPLHSLPKQPSHRKTQSAHPSFNSRWQLDSQSAFERARFERRSSHQFRLQ